MDQPLAEFRSGVKEAVKEFPALVTLLGVVFLGLLAVDIGRGKLRLSSDTIEMIIIGVLSFATGVLAGRYGGSARPNGHDGTPLDGEQQREHEPIPRIRRSRAAG